MSNVKLLVRSRLALDRVVPLALRLPVLREENEMREIEEMVLGPKDGRTRAELNFQAQDEILEYAILAASSAEECGDLPLAGAIRDHATRIAKRWKIEKPGLPATFIRMGQ